MPHSRTFTIAVRVSLPLLFAGTICAANADGDHSEVLDLRAYVKTSSAGDPLIPPLRIGDAIECGRMGGRWGYVFGTTATCCLPDIWPTSATCTAMGGDWFDSTRSCVLASAQACSEAGGTWTPADGELWIPSAGRGFCDLFSKMERQEASTCQRLGLRRCAKRVCTSERAAPSAGRSDESGIRLPRCACP